MVSRVMAVIPEGTAACAKYSLETKPPNSGMPIMDRAPTEKPRPAPMSRKALPRRFFRLLWWPLTAESRPAQRKSRGLQQAWTRMWKKEAISPSMLPSPTPMKMYPTWATEE